MHVTIPRQMLGRKAHQSRPDLAISRHLLDLWGQPNLVRLRPVVSLARCKSMRVGMPTVLTPRLVCPTGSPAMNRVRIPLIKVTQGKEAPLFLLFLLLVTPATHDSIRVMTSVMDSRTTTHACTPTMTCAWRLTMTLDNTPVLTRVGGLLPRLRHQAHQVRRMTQDSILQGHTRGSHILGWQIPGSSNIPAAMLPTEASPDSIPRW